jgi:UrcA family protein
MIARNALPLLVLATLALAPPPGTAASRVVSYADLNLGTTAGQQALQRRIAAAARSVCAPLDGLPLKQAAEYRACVAQATARARSTLPAASLARR